MSPYLIFIFIAPVIGILFLRLFVETKRKFILVAGVIWLLYAVYETSIYLRLICSGECNIRVDLLVIYPVLVVASLVTVILYLKQNSANSGRID